MTAQTTERDAAASIDAAAEVTRWLQDLESQLQRDRPALGELFVDDSWWRDLLALTWDIRTYRGLSAIEAMVSEFGPGTAPSGFAIEEGKTPAVSEATGFPVIEAFITFRTRQAHGRGVIRLLQAGDAWKAWTVTTSMEDLVGHEERRTSIQDVAMPEYNTAIRDRKTFYETRDEERTFADSDPTVLIVGAGHSGLMLAARLRHLGVSHLVVDKEERLGDNWRRRYSGLSLHDTMWYARFPYLEYPSNWPLYTPAELMGDWIESYVNLLRLNAWTRTEVEKATYDEAEGRWTVQLRQDGTERTLHPTHLVFATGLSGLPHTPDVPGADKFRGEIVHSSAFTGGRDFVGKKAIVVGTGSSGHDVAQSFYECGAASTTMVQRGGSYVMSGKNGIPVFHGAYWTENGPALEDADLLSNSMPYTLMLEQVCPPATSAIAEMDAEMLAGLEKAGFEVDLGRGTEGMLGFALERGGGYYIDKGCSQLIIDGDVRLQRGEIAEFTETGVIYSDGTKEAADVVVFATGWSNMREMTRPIIGDEAADKVTPVWGLDEFGELRGTFRQSGHPKLWYVAGAIGMVRAHSKYVALQILGVETGALQQA
ncbi:flavin-containing monooxygenase [Pseudonocardia halophobica]|uniref:flavin-containing monooxygenase n=1 Tax=Pseudonocardia halophobica TaxID=29401 RepID=UPI003D9246A7